MPPSTARTYVTLAGPASAEVEVRRSRFVCDLAPAASEDEARAFIERVRSSSREARHHCTAFVLGPDGGTQRSNDDGEPSGTAGAPMLDVLRGRGLTDVVAVVTRWFGGILLGTGGLIRAYGDAVSAALEVATPRQRELRDGLVVEVDHARAPRVEHALRELHGVTVRSVDYVPNGVRIEVATTVEGGAALSATVASLTAGLGRISPGDATWVDT
jgi:uncharacterized YigZ family protein